MATGQKLPNKADGAESSRQQLCAQCQNKVEVAMAISNSAFVIEGGVIVVAITPG